MSPLTWPDARGWIGIGQFVLTALIFAMIWDDPSFLKIDAFLILATAIVITGWNGGPVAWAYSATKGGGELADKNADLVRQQVETATDNGHVPKDAADAAQQTADAAAEKAHEFTDATPNEKEL